MPRPRFALLAAAALSAVLAAVGWFVYSSYAAVQPGAGSYVTEPR